MGHGVKKGSKTPANGDLKRNSQTSKYNIFSKLFCWAGGSFNTQIFIAVLWEFVGTLMLAIRGKRSSFHSSFLHVQGYSDYLFWESPWDEENLRSKKWDRGGCIRSVARILFWSALYYQGLGLWLVLRRRRQTLQDVQSFFFTQRKILFHFFKKRSRVPPSPPTHTHTQAFRNKYCKKRI